MKIVQIFLLFLNVCSAYYNSTQLNTCLWLSGAAYCGKENYETMCLAGPAKGFIYDTTLYNIKTDIQGYIGLLDSTKSIYVVLRGSSSTLNWLDDFEMRQQDYPYCTNCSVHYGFYNSALGIRNKTIETIKILQKKYPLYTIILTGHSYGAAVCELLAMEIKESINININIQIYNFGKPRIGNLNYANFINTQIPINWRIVHNRDVVPHLPPTKVFEYIHSCRELFENEKGELIVCSNIICEDPKCSAQFSIYETNSEDHSYYLQHYVACNSSIEI
jgi:hypothetical protein